VTATFQTFAIESTFLLFFVAHFYISVQIDFSFQMHIDSVLLQ